MSDEFQSQSSGVESTPAAEVQTQSTETQSQQQTEQSTQQSGVQTDSAAGNQGVEQAFARRLASERQKMEQEYSPYRSFVETEAKRNNMTTDQYLRAVEQQRQAEERQQYIDQGINPDLVNQLLEQHPDIQFARQMKSQQEQQARFNSEAEEFFSMFPDVKVEEIPQEVYSLKTEKGLSFTDAYLRVMFPKMRTNAEQQAIQTLRGSANRSPGSLSGESQDQKFGYSALSATDKKALRDRVLRGENVNLS